MDSSSRAQKPSTTSGPLDQSHSRVISPADGDRLLRAAEQQRRSKQQAGQEHCINARASFDRSTRAASQRYPLATVCRDGGAQRFWRHIPTARMSAEPTPLMAPPTSTRMSEDHGGSMMTSATPTRTAQMKMATQTVIISRVRRSTRASCLSRRNPSVATPQECLGGVSDRPLRTVYRTA